MFRLCLTTRRPFENQRFRARARADVFFDITYQYSGNELISNQISTRLTVNTRVDHLGNDPVGHYSLPVIRFVIEIYYRHDNYTAYSVYRLWRDGSCVPIRFCIYFSYFLFIFPPDLLRGTYSERGPCIDNTNETS